MGRTGRFPLLFAVVVAGAISSPAAAQAPDETTARRAPRPYVAPRLAFSVTFGTVDPGELQGQRVLAERLDAGGAVIDSELLDRTLVAEPGLQVGASALLGLTPAWAVRLGVSVGRATLAAGYGGDDEWEAAVKALPVPASDGLEITSGEAALRFRMLSGRRVQPYAEIGVAAVRIEAEDAAYPGAGALTGETAFGGTVGLGAIVPVWRRLSGRFQAMSHLLGNPAEQAQGGAAVATGDTLRVTFVDPTAAPFADPARELLRTLQLGVGFSLELGSALRSTGAAAAPPSGSRPSSGS